MSDEGTMTGPLADAFETAYQRLTASRSLTADAIGLIFSDFGLPNTDVGRLVKARVAMTMDRLRDDGAAREQGIAPERFVETLLSWLALELLLTGLLTAQSGGAT